LAGKTDPIVTQSLIYDKAPAHKAGYWQKFMQFAANQESNRFGWLAFSFFAHGCVLAPLTLLIVTMNGNHFALWIPCLFAFAITEIVNLSALPTKITIPVFLASLLVDIGVIASVFLLY
jgi:hypothetical protein